MRRGQAQVDLASDIDALDLRIATTFQPIRQILALDVFHGQEGLIVVGFVDVVDATDIGVGDVPREEEFLVERLCAAVRRVPIFLAGTSAPTVVALATDLPPGRPLPSRLYPTASQCGTGRRASFPEPNCLAAGRVAVRRPGAGRSVRGQT